MPNLYVLSVVHFNFAFIEATLRNPQKNVLHFLLITIWFLPTFPGGRLSLPRIKKAKKKSNTRLGNCATELRFYDGLSEHVLQGMEAGKSQLRIDRGFILVLRVVLFFFILFIALLILVFVLWKTGWIFQSVGQP